MACCMLTHMQVTDVFKLEDYQLALDKMNSREALKIAIKP
jgi:D-arabinitol dehydrogenase (NADP+)